MSKYRVTLLAQRDLDEIWDYIARDNPAAADHLMDEILVRFRLISKNRSIGAKRSEFGENIRIHPFNSYSIFYDPGSEFVEIIRVLHSARDATQLFENDLPN